jgi:hypothetical protein
VGYSGERPPIPPSEIVPPIDPNPDPPIDPDDPSIPDPLTLVLETGEFHKLDYLAMGYNRFDVMCIGGAGGNAGRIRETIPDSATHASPHDFDLFFDTFRVIFGGGGGGGGIHRIKGRLALLPTVVEVVVGEAGADGAYGAVTSPFHDWRSGSYPAPPVPEPGQDGQASSFGGVICRASGGKGGTASLGGAGGIGNAELTGGGADPGASGTWDGVIGSGGGGGRGALIDTTFGATGTNYARGGSGGTPGGSGAVSLADPTTKGPGGISAPYSLDYNLLLTDGSGANYVTPAHYDGPHAYAGQGGGAKPFLLNGENIQYGSKAEGRPGTGLVIIRLTYVIT